MLKFALIFASVVMVITPFISRVFGEGVRTGGCDFTAATTVRVWDKVTFNQVDITERGYLLAPQLWDTQTGALDFNEETANYFFTQLEPAFEANFFIGDDTNMQLVGLIEVRFGVDSAWVFMQDQAGYEVVDSVDSFDNWHGCGFYQVPYYSNAAPLVWFYEMYNRNQPAPLTMQ